WCSARVTFADASERLTANSERELRSFRTCCRLFSVRRSPFTVHRLFDRRIRLFPRLGPVAERNIQTAADDDGHADEGVRVRKIAEHEEAEQHDPQQLHIA